MTGDECDRNLLVRFIPYNGRRAAMGAAAWAHCGVIAVLLALGAGIVFGCSTVPRFGTGGNYAEGKDQFMRGRGGDMDKAVTALDSVVRDDPTYRDSLTLLGRAYYNKVNYDIAKQILQRALLVKKDDEIAWVALGLAQLQVGEDDKGTETLQGAITLISKVSRSGYRNYPNWDSKGLIRSYISRSVVDLRKGPEAKASLIRDCETLLSRMDDEENYQKQSTDFTRRYDYSSGR
jgi:tetratricopeptide (TPR) repeat protein